MHPGYGFLSEQARFARACHDAGLVFVGPEPAVIEAMGSKLTAKRVMADAGVPVLEGVPVAEAVDDAALREAAVRVGYPLLVKAAVGGGGRGMRIVEGEAELPGAVGAAQREAAAAFGDGTVFLERFVASPRHVEVQIVGDAHGRVVHLFERECSIQRRYQKVIEESPSPAVSAELRAELGAAAVSAGTAIGYTNAGTVEFVLDETGRFWFLEVNTRLQVEHPVTELVTGVDLVQVQLRVAAGEPLPDAVDVAMLRGHAIEARLYAEDVPAGFVPTSGPIHRFRVPAGPGVRVDAGYADGSSVSTEYDGMLAKVIAWAPTREEATHRLVGALRDAELDGPSTNRDLLVRALSSGDWAAGRTDTGFVERHGGPASGPLPARRHRPGRATRSRRRWPAWSRRGAARRSRPGCRRGGAPWDGPSSRSSWSAWTRRSAWCAPPPGPAGRRPSTGSSSRGCGSGRRRRRESTWRWRACAGCCGSAGSATRCSYKTGGGRPGGGSRLASRPPAPRPRPGRCGPRCRGGWSRCWSRPATRCGSDSPWCRSRP